MCPSATQCSWMACLVPWLSHCWTSLCVNLHWLSVVGQRETGGRGKDTAEVVGMGVQWKLEPMLEDTQLVHLYIVYCNLCSYDFVRGSCSLVVFKSRDITLLTKVPIVKAIFPLAMYGCESWTIKKTEHWIIDAFELWCWRRLLRVPWTARSNQSILKKISLEYFKDWCWSSNTLATWCEEPTHCKDPDAGKDRRQEEKGVTEDEMVGWHHWLNGHESEKTPGGSEGQRTLRAAFYGVSKSQTWLGDSVTTTLHVPGSQFFKVFYCVWNFLLALKLYFAS